MTSSVRRFVEYVDRPMSPELARKEMNPRAAANSMRTVISTRIMVTSERYTISNIIAITRMVKVVTFAVPLLPTSNWSATWAAAPVTYALTPGGACVWSTMSRTASTDSRDNASP